MPLIDMLSLIFIFFLMVAWIGAIISIFGDVLRSEDLSGLAKGMWMLFIIILPWLGILVYLAFRGTGMEERSRKTAAKAAGHSTADELAKLADLRDKGIVTEEEFKAQKSRLLS